MNMFLENARCVQVDVGDGLLVNVRMLERGRQINGVLRPTSTNPLDHIGDTDSHEMELSKLLGSLQTPHGLYVTQSDSGDQSRSRVGVL